MTKEELIGIVDKIEQVLKEHKGGYADKEALVAIERLCRDISFHCPDSYIGEKTGSLLSFAEILYSQRKHQQYGGPDKVINFVYADCSRLRSYFTSHLNV